MLADRMRMASSSGWKTFDVQDATVVNQAYDTSGNGGRKLVRLDNGWLVSAVMENFKGTIQIYVDKLDDQGFVPLTYKNVSASTYQSSWSIQNKGNDIFLIYHDSSSVEICVFDAEEAQYVNISSSAVWVKQVRLLDYSQTAFNGISLAINPQGTELHACWSSKNPTYKNSFNIRYAKGTINGDGSVSWGAVEQITTYNNSSLYFRNPSIVICDGKPVIIMEMYNGSSYFIYCYYFNGSSWKQSTVYNGSSYTQSSPSAIFVPSEVNGLPQGRIWVAWHGMDAVDTSRYNIRVSYSDDSGVSWSVPQKLTSGNSTHYVTPTLAANTNNNIYVLFADWTKFSIWKVENKNNVWGSAIDVTDNNGSVSNYAHNNPSSLYDPTFQLDFSLPLFVFQDTKNIKVGFYGTWKSK